MASNHSPQHDGKHGTDLELTVPETAGAASGEPDVQAERAREEQRLETVIRGIRRQIDELAEVAGERKEETVGFRKGFFEDVTVYLETTDDLFETAASIRQQAMVLEERERSLAIAKKRLDQLRRLERSPYFGRVDFQEQGERTAEPIYIGMFSFMDEETEQYWVYDWRAPVSSLFYDHSPGKASYETPGGVIDGTITLKRQYVIRDGKLHGMFDTGDAIGDEVLAQVLGMQADVHMRTIVATIQREQNRIIRNDKSKVVLVHGAAGSGKTSVALQRAAYLLYRHRKTLTADNMLLFSPNPLFMSYISTVLPELGEANVRQSTFQQFIERRLGKRMRAEDNFAQLEYLLEHAGEPECAARLEAIRWKGGAVFFRTVERYADELKRSGMKFFDLTFRDRVVVSAEQMTQHFYSLDSSIKVSNRLELMQEWLLEQLKLFEKEEIGREWVEDAIEYLDESKYRQARQLLNQRSRKGKAGFHDDRQYRNVLKQMVVREEFKPLRQQVKQLAFVDFAGLYRRLLEDRQLLDRLADGQSPPAGWDRANMEAIRNMDAGLLLHEDATPFVLLMDLLSGFRTYSSSVKYVLIDEGQDYSAFQLLFIRNLFPGSKLTILGDWNQAIMAYNSDEPELEPAASVFAAEGAETFRLHRSYRSTREIVEFTRGLLGAGSAIEPFERRGGKPVLTLLAEGDRSALARAIAADAKRLQESGARTIAVICKTAKECTEAAELLAPHLKVQRVTAETYVFEPGVLVVPAYLAKGVEFDAVILFDASRSRYARETERKLFYTACTRAMHHLFLYSPGEPSPFVAELPEALYEVRRTEGTPEPADGKA